MDYTIRPGTPADTSQVDALLARTYPALLKADYAPSVLVTAIPVISRARPELMRCGTYYVALTHGGNLVGAGGWTPDKSDPTLGHIRHVVTDLDYLRQGIAGVLMQTSFQSAQEAGCTKMECWSTLTAERFYQSQGFQTVGPMDVTLMGGISFPALRMERDLP
ncbi:GNAT family N-acetyltransferase [Algirhabdus cladophorae]|uniref:GNAT family N-acetyltransferase n=1 Tax=Algirhabdus cladophorae TaxID=3377108 RepID=UPI003B845B7D